MSYFSAIKWVVPTFSDWKVLGTNPGAPLSWSNLTDQWFLGIPLLSFYTGWKISWNSDNGFRPLVFCDQGTRRGGTHTQIAASRCNLPPHSCIYWIICWEREGICTRRSLKKKRALCRDLNPCSHWNELYQTLIICWSQFIFRSSRCLHQLAMRHAASIDLAMRWWCLYFPSLESIRIFNVVTEYSDFLLLIIINP